MTKLDHIKENVSDIFNIDLATRSRQEIYIVARAVYYKIAREKTLHPLIEIGRALNVNHATVLNGLKKFEQLDQYPDYIEVINRCLNLYQMRTIGKKEIVNTYPLKQKIIALQAQIDAMQISINPIFIELNALPEDKLNDFIKYRAEPYLKMNA